MSKQASHPQTDAVRPQSEGINMAAVCMTLARVLVWLEESGYSEKEQQDDVIQHDALPDPASDLDTQEA